MNYYKKDGKVIQSDIAPAETSGTKYFAEIEGKKTELTDEAVYKAFDMGIEVSVEHEKETPWEKATQGEYNKHVKSQLGIE